MMGYNATILCHPPTELVRTFFLYEIKEILFKVYGKCFDKSTVDVLIDAENDTDRIDELVAVTFIAPHKGVSTITMEHAEEPLYVYYHCSNFVSNGNNVAITQEQKHQEESARTASSLSTSFSDQEGLITLSDVAKKPIMIVGAGGIGCELLKNIILAGYNRNLTIVDLDYVDGTNLNRQFLFGSEHVNYSKAVVGGQRMQQWFYEYYLWYLGTKVIEICDFFFVEGLKKNDVGKEKANNGCLNAKQTQAKKKEIGCLLTDVFVNGFQSSWSIAEYHSIQYLPTLGDFEYKDYLFLNEEQFFGKHPGILFIQSPYHHYSVYTPGYYATEVRPEFIKEQFLLRSVLKKNNHNGSEFQAFHDFFLPIAPQIRVIHNNIKDTYYDVDFYNDSKFAMVLNGLDNTSARRHVNKICMDAENNAIREVIDALHEVEREKNGNEVNNANDVIYGSLKKRYEYLISLFTKRTTSHNPHKDNNLLQYATIKGIPLIESGTAGYNGQVQPIIRGINACYDCHAKTGTATFHEGSPLSSSPSGGAGEGGGWGLSFPVCTIHARPTNMLHCVHYCKELYERTFGLQQPALLGQGYKKEHDNNVHGVLQTSESRENNSEKEKGDASTSSGEMTYLKNVQKTSLTTVSGVTKLLAVLFHDQINKLLELKSADTWKGNPPEAISMDMISNSMNEIDNDSLERKRVRTRHNYINEEIILHNIKGNNMLLNGTFNNDYNKGEKISEREGDFKHDFTIPSTQQSLKELALAILAAARRSMISDDDLCSYHPFCKEDDIAVRIVTQAANLRAFNFHIPRQNINSLQTIAGNIIPSIATSNAIAAAGVLNNAVLVLKKVYLADNIDHDAHYNNYYNERNSLNLSYLYLRKVAQQRRRKIKIFGNTNTSKNTTMLVVEHLLIHSSESDPSNPACMVCKGGGHMENSDPDSVKCSALIQVRLEIFLDAEQWTLLELVGKIFCNLLGLASVTVVNNATGNIIFESEDYENLGTKLLKNWMMRNQEGTGDAKSNISSFSLKNYKNNDIVLTPSCMANNINHIDAPSSLFSDFVTTNNTDPLILPPPPDPSFQPFKTSVVFTVTDLDCDDLEVLIKIIHHPSLFQDEGKNQRVDNNTDINHKKGVEYCMKTNPPRQSSSQFCINGFEDCETIKGWFIEFVDAQRMALAAKTKSAESAYTAVPASNQQHAVKKNRGVVSNNLTVNKSIADEEARKLSNMEEEAFVVLDDSEDDVLVELSNGSAAAAVVNKNQSTFGEVERLRVNPTLKRSRGGSIVDASNVKEAAHFTTVTEKNRRCEEEENIIEIL